MRKATPSRSSVSTKVRSERLAVDALEQRRMLSATTGPVPALDTGAAVNWWIPSVTGIYNHNLVEGEFRTYSAIRTADNSAIDAAGLRPIKVSYSDLYVINADGSLDRSQVDEDRVRRRAREASDAGTPWVIDIEHWAIDIRSSSEAEVQATLDKFLQIIDWAKDERPDVQIGFYGVLPLRDYWTPVNLDVVTQRAANEPGFAKREMHRVTEAQDRVSEWQRANDFLQPLADAVDFIVPSLYTFYDDPSNWVIYAEANLNEAAQWGKPVVPFLWPEFHDGGALEGQMIDPAFWQLQLDTVRAHADSVVIWGNDSLSIADEAWLQLTIDFMAQNLADDTGAPNTGNDLRRATDLASSNDVFIDEPVVTFVKQEVTRPTSVFTASRPHTEITRLENTDPRLIDNVVPDSSTRTSSQHVLANRLLAFAQSNPSLFVDAFTSGHAQDLLDSLKDEQ